MFDYIFITVAGLVLFWLSKTLLSLYRNIAIAKASGLPYAVARKLMFDVLYGRSCCLRGISRGRYCWLFLDRNPWSRSRYPHVMALLEGLAMANVGIHPAQPRPRLRLRRLVEPHRSWYFPQELREIMGEVYLIVSPGQVFMSCCNAEATMQMVMRRNDFVKPVEIYGIVDIFGSSILSLEGPEWKRHRKIVAPAFSERSNARVWEESLRQAAGLLKFWSDLEGNAPGDIKVKDTARETALMTLHVISGIGFGVMQNWPGEDEHQQGAKAIPGFNTANLGENHKLAFKDSLNTLVHGMIWMALVPVWLLSELGI
jgi:hypothetical protein